ncbi:MAG: hypothetical protein ACW99A_01765 [Candidatus Kariarchaeaceae archaeon]
MNRAENKSKPNSLAAIQLECLVCNQNTTYRKLVPEDLNATNSQEFILTTKAMYNELMKLKEENSTDKS